MMDAFALHQRRPDLFRSKTRPPEWAKLHSRWRHFQALFFYLGPPAHILWNIRREAVQRLSSQRGKACMLNHQRVRPCAAPYAHRGPRYAYLFIMIIAAGCVAWQATAVHNDRPDLDLDPGGLFEART